MPPRKAAAKRVAPVSVPVVEDSTPLTSIDSPLTPSPSTSTLRTSDPSSSFSSFRYKLKDALILLASDLKKRRDSNIGVALTAEEADAAVETALDRAGRPQLVEGVVEEPWKVSVRKSAVERNLEEMLFEVAMLPSDESDSDSSRYGLLSDLMDVILNFSEKDYCDTNLPLICLGSLLDLQTISGCHHIFAYIESRVEQLTKNMNPQQGKGPLLLRLLNELLRRLPKSKTEDVIFSGRILMFLSSVFPLAEKSGVNLRGNFNVGKGTVFEEEAKVVENTEDGMDVDQVATPAEEGAVASPPDASAAPPPESREFYVTFWSLQRYFNNPPILFAPALRTAEDNPFKLLRNGLNRTLEAFAAATTKESQLAGSGSSSSTNPALEDDETVREHYFFPKFLTSPNLLELEIADPNFRKQLLVQMMVLYQYLLSFTPEARARDLAITTNPPALLPHVLSPTNEKWINELRVTTQNEMLNMPGGNRFKATVELILQREQNWINWKIKSCLPYEKPALDVEAKSKLARSKLVAITRKPKPFPYKMGNASLSHLWTKNTVTLDGFEGAPSQESFDDLVRAWRLSNKMLLQKNTILADLTEGGSTDLAKISSINDEIEQLDKKSKALHWRAIRIASTKYLNYFDKIGDGDLELLVAAIDEGDRKKEESLAAVVDAKEEADIVSIRSGTPDSAEIVVVEGQEQVAVALDVPILLDPKDEILTPGTPKRTRGAEDDVDGGKEVKKMKLDSDVLLIDA